MVLLAGSAVKFRGGNECPLTLRVFGCLPCAGASGCTEAGVRKASKEETAGCCALAVVLGYGDFNARRGVARWFLNGNAG